MNADGMGNRARTVTEDEAREELDRILSDHRFHVSERNRAFLRFVADAVFEGRTESIKAYSIAVDVFGRPSSFDAVSDPIVRIEATRLRSALSQYYEAFGADGSVRIAIPKGRYIPEFTRCSVPCPEANGHEEVEAQPSVEPAATAVDVHKNVVSSTPPGSPFALSTLAVLLAFAIAALFLLWATSGTTVFTRKPLVTFTMNQGDGKPTFGTDIASDGLMIALASYGTLRLKPAADVTGSTPSTAQASKPSWRSGEVDNSYAISLRYIEDDRAVSVLWQVTDSGTGEVVGNGLDTVSTEGRTAQVASTELVNQLARKIAGSHGLINTLETHRSLPASTMGNTCVLRAEFAVDQHDAAGFAAAKGCLEASLRADPNDADANAALSLLLVAIERQKSVVETGGANLERALALANKAAAIAPNSSRAGMALIVALYNSGRIEAALSTGRRMMPLYPHDADIPATLGLFSYLAGHYDDGLRLAANATDLAGATPRDAMLVFMFNAYRERRYADVLSLVQELAYPDAVSEMVRVAALGRLGDPAIERETRATVAKLPDFVATVSATLAGRLYDPALSDDLRTGLTAAGLSIPDSSTHAM